MNFHPKIVLIYALLSLKRRESNLRAFLMQKLEFCHSFRPSNAHIFAKKSARLLPKMSPSEELATLLFYCFCLHSALLGRATCGVGVVGARKIFSPLNGLVGLSMEVEFPEVVVEAMSTISP